MPSPIVKNFPTIFRTTASKYVFLFFLLVQPLTNLLAQQVTSFNQHWEFLQNADTVINPGMSVKTNTQGWRKVSLPHTAHIEMVQDTGKQWQGICFYRKFFQVPATSKGRHMAIQFDAAMQEADVFLNGQLIFKHVGGYLPFYIDVTDGLKYGAENNIVVRLDNRDNPLIPPGKPLKDLDFNYYSGIYRNAWLISKNKVHISNAIAANRIAGGGVFIHTEKIEDSIASLYIKTDIKNDNVAERQVRVRTNIMDAKGKIVAKHTSSLQRVGQLDHGSFVQQITVAHPTLWSPETPYLYQVKIEVLEGDKILDRESVRTGIRTIRLDSTTFYLNGEPLKIRGTNRHQEYPYLGNAISDRAQYRDAWKIRQAGFNFVRSSHYPHATAFLDACDELGLLVMDAIPGWQFFGNDSFQKNSYQDIRDMIRRDRNHPSIILWESSLNESGMSRNYMQTSHNIVHEELPFEGIYSAGWIDQAYDVFLPARQHGKAPDYWKKYTKKKPLLIAEYGDWEYYAQNAGFNQKEFKNLKKEEANSRQFRGNGQKAMLQQALNYQESHNDNLYGPAIGDANWLMFDYKRGYATDSTLR